MSDSIPDWAADAPGTGELPGSTERSLPGPMHHKGPGPAVSGWIEPRRRGPGGRALALHRLTGLVIVFYLYLHLAVLSMLLIGRSAWSSFLSLVTAKGFLAFEVVLIAAVLFHGLNGIRVAFVGSGIAVSRERAMLWTGGVIGTAAIVFAALHVMGAL
jgi:succinate dehydrogenase / fumarate reductase, cytochrome b subunit